MKSALKALACAGSISLFVFTVTATTHAALGPADIIAIWLFDEGEGDSANDASRNPHDMDGALQGGMSWHWHGAGEKPKWVDGKFGKALKCEG